MLNTKLSNVRNHMGKSLAEWLPFLRGASLNESELHHTESRYELHSMCTSSPPPVRSRLIIRLMICHITISITSFLNHLHAIQLNQAFLIMHCWMKILMLLVYYFITLTPRRIARTVFKSFNLKVAGCHFGHLGHVYTPLSASMYTFCFTFTNYATTPFAYSATYFTSAAISDTCSFLYPSRSTQLSFSPTLQIQTPVVTWKHRNKDNYEK